MAPPNNRQPQLRRLLDAKEQKLAIVRADLELTDNIILNDDDFDLDGMLSDPGLVQTRWKDLIKWKPAADHVMKAAYIGDSRARK
jgi:hypothetical protein